MQERTRTRIIWTLVAATAAYALVNVVLHYAGAGFGAGWLIASVLVYGLLLMAALVLGFTDPGSPARAPERPAATEPDAAPVSVLYETATGRLESAGGRAYLALTHDGARSLDDVERIVDARGGRAAHVPDAKLETVLDGHALDPAERDGPASRRPYTRLGASPSGSHGTEVAP